MTFSSQSAFLPFKDSWTAMWVIAVVSVAREERGWEGQGKASRMSWAHAASQACVRDRGAECDRCGGA